MLPEMTFEKMAGSANIVIKNDNLILDTHVNYENECDSIDYVISEIEKMYDFTLQISKVLGI